MVRSRRTRILVEGDAALRQRLANEVRSNCTVQIVEQAAWAMVMLTVRETARNSLFHPGEVLVSQAKVFVQGFPGLGLIAGDHLEAAEDLALIDGACNAAIPLFTHWDKLLEDEEQRIQLARTLAWSEICATKVDFKSMDSEVIG